jgi:hypothetical protein
LSFPFPDEDAFCISSSLLCCTSQRLKAIDWPVISSAAVIKKKIIVCFLSMHK